MKIFTIIPRHIYAVKRDRFSRWQFVRAEDKTMAALSMVHRFVWR